MSFAEFIHMSGYARYVWSAYGISLVVLIIIAWSARRSYGELLAKMRRRLASQEGSKS